MPQIIVTQKGDFKRTNKYLDKLKKARFFTSLEKYAQLGVEALSNATPVDSGLTADSWGYEIEVDNRHATITWTNNNVQDGWFNVAIGLQYGHGTATGGYVQGIDYINPAMRDVFTKMVEDIWMEVIAVE